MSNDAVHRNAAVAAVTDLPGRGRGVVATRPIAAGETALIFRGPRRRLTEIADFTHVLEIGPGLYLGSSGGVDDLVNHSCEPDCVAFVDGKTVGLRAIRDIAPGEELTYDYSTMMLTDPTRFVCACGAASCRGVVTRWSELPAAVRARQLRLAIVPAFIADAGNDGGGEDRASHR